MRVYMCVLAPVYTCEGQRPMANAFLYSICFSFATGSPAEPGASHGVPLALTCVLRTQDLVDAQPTGALYY